MPKYVLNPETLLYEEKEDPKYLKHVHWAVAIVVAVGFVLLYFWLYTSVFHWDLPKTAMLKRRAAATIAAQSLQTTSSRPCRRLRALRGFPL